MLPTLRLVNTIRLAILDGVRHYNSAGELLEFDGDIIRCLREEGRVYKERAMAAVAS